MTRVTRSAVAARARAARSKATISKQANSNAASSKPDNRKEGNAKTVATSSKRKREDDVDAMPKRLRQERRKKYLLYPTESSDEEISDKEDSGEGSDTSEEDPKDDSDDEARRSSSTSDGSEKTCSSEEDSDDGSKADSEEGSGEEDSEEEDCEKGNGRKKKGLYDGASTPKDSTSRDKVIDVEEYDDEDDEQDEDEEDDIPIFDDSPYYIQSRSPNLSPVDKGDRSYPSKAQSDCQKSPNAAIAPLNDNHHVLSILEVDYGGFRSVIREAMETVMPIEIASRIADREFPVPPRCISRKEAVAKDSTDGQYDENGILVDHTTSLRGTSEVGEEFCSPPTAIVPNSRVTLTIPELRGTSSRHWNVKECPSILATETVGDWNPPPDDPNLTMDENRKNLLIRRALKWPLLTWGYESLESFMDAKVAQVRMDCAIEHYVIMFYLSERDGDGGLALLNQVRDRILRPAMQVLKAAVDALKQPDLVPSRKGSAASVTAPVPEHVSVKKNIYAAILAKDRQRQSRRKKALQNSALQPPVLSSLTKAQVVSTNPQKQHETSLAKASSTKTTPSILNPPPILPSSSKTSKVSPAKTSRPKTAIHSSTKAPAMTLPLKTSIPPPSTPPSTRALIKKSPTKAAEAESSLLQDSKEPVVPNEPAPVASSHSKALAMVSESPKQQKKPPLDIPAAKAAKGKCVERIVSAPGEAPVARNKPQSQLGLVSAQALPPKQCLSSSPTSASSSESESSSPPRRPLRPRTPAPPEPQVKGATKRNVTRIIPRELVVDSLKGSLASSTVEGRAKIRQSPETLTIPTTPPIIPTDLADVLQGLRDDAKSTKLMMAEHSKSSKLMVAELSARLDNLSQFVDPSS
ncbi:hypothetical protein V493_03444 [Pseudogymnoascus sp. VKM F-4281 (FW-2241)]|nr:hypothetical protein V493_03444 [Pseudogymnoascus sp. VKM F-4281 (FW-2241)]